ncbi:tetratricopeptide repeat protein [Schlesneria sp.]|uniref:tetratricopeptide repeat protein n=1 Tax=Schlesneria sp. TaxID=2762018 RepID=UPI002EFFFAE2
MDNTTIYRRILSTRRPWVCGVVLFVLISGCATPWEKSALLKETYPNIDRVQGPTERALRNVFRRQKEESDEEELSLSGKSLKPIAGTEEYLAATELYKEEKFLEAQKAFKKVGKKFKKSEIREDALFMEAEAAWQLDNYSRAHDIYAVLLKEYPSTRHLNVVSERMFKVGRLWLDFPEVAKLDEIEQVNFEDPNKKLPSEEKPHTAKSRFVFVPNLTNKKEPLFDTPGNGVAALSAVWMNDPTGPLADDAMMLVASYHARKGNYIEADRYFQMLRETFPNSPHVQNAFLLGSHVKLMSYQGPDYETRTLEEAQKLKEATVRLYPNLPEKDRIQSELARIEDAKALIDWSQAKFWLRKGNKKAAAIYCHQVIDKFPNSQYAKLARAKLVELGPEYASGAAFLSPIDQKKTTVFDNIVPKNFTYRLKNYPLVGGPRSKTAKSTGTAPKRFSETSEEEAEDEVVEDEEMYEEEAPAEEPVNPPRRRNSWGDDDQTPDRLPPGSESEAREMEPNKPGRARL